MRLVDEWPESTIETDYYVPITIEYPSNTRADAELMYWFFKSTDSSYFEIKIDSMIKKIFSVIIITVNSVQKKSSLKMDKIPYVVGNPIVDTSAFEGKRHYTENVDFRVMHDDDSVLILMKDHDAVAKRIGMPHLELLVNAGMEIVGFLFKDLPEKRDYMEDPVWMGSEDADGEDDGEFL